MNKIKEWFESLFAGKNGQPPKLKMLIKGEGFSSVLSSCIAAFLGILVGFVVILIFNANVAFAGLGKILAGGFSGGIRGVGDVFYYATPLILTGLSVGFAFKTGLFNIGATGQYTMGLFVSLYLGHTLDPILNSRILWVVCLLGGMAGGMLWGAIPGIFKALFNVNEVIVCIMSNYIGMYLVDMLIKSMPGTVYNATYNWTNIMPSNSDLPKLGMDVIFTDKSNVNGGIIIAILIAVITFIVLYKTNFGFELRACGQNKHAATYAGINAKRNIVLAMVIAGALAGLGGALQIQAGVKGTYSPVNALESAGFNGIAVALLGTSNPIGVIFAGIFFAHLQQGGFYMQSLGIKNEIISVIVGVIIYFAAFALLIKGFLKRKLSLDLGSTQPSPQQPADKADTVVAEETPPDIVETPVLDTSMQQASPSKTEDGLTESKIEVKQQQKPKKTSTGKTQQKEDK